MAEQFGLLYYIHPTYVATPNTSEGLRLYRSTIDNQYYVKKSDGTSELFSVGITGMMQLIGTFDASTNAFPLAGTGSGAGGAIQKGDTWLISVAGTLPGGQEVVPGDVLIALIDVPGNNPANWFIVEKNLGYVPEDVANKAIDFTTLNNTLYPSVLAVENRISGTPNQILFYVASGFDGDNTFTWDNGAQIFSIGGANGTSITNVNGGTGFDSTFSIHQDDVVGWAFDVYNRDYSRSYIRAGQDGSGAGTTAQVAIMLSGGANVITAYDMDGRRSLGVGSHFNGDLALINSRENISDLGTQGLFSWTNTLSAFLITSEKNLGYAVPYISADANNGAGITESFKLTSKGDSYFIGNTNQIGFGIQAPTARVHIKGVAGNYALKVESDAGARLFDITNAGVISMPTVQVGDAGLVAGDLYFDTEANITAAGDLFLARVV